MFDLSKYHFVDRGRASESPFINDGAVLYRTMSVPFAKRDIALNAESGLSSRGEGRYNYVQQTSAYCATHVTTSFSEILSHMHHHLMISLQKRLPPSQILADFVSKRVKLAIMEVGEIRGLIHIESLCAMNFDSRVRGTAVVSPLHEYTPLQEVSAAIRSDPSKYRGILYPSARFKSDEPRDLCCIFFGNETASIRAFHSIEVELSLVDETSYSSGICDCDPFLDRVHPKVGHYSFADLTMFDALKSKGLIHPSDLELEGFIPFRRE